MPATTPPTPDRQAHAPRRSPEGADLPLDLGDAAHQLLTQAHDLDAGRSARTLTPGADQPVKQSLLALVGGRSLDDHVAPGPTTLHALVGHVLVHHDGGTIDLAAGQFVRCPTSRHAVQALEDSVLLLTVAPAASRRPQDEQGVAA